MERLVDQLASLDVPTPPLPEHDVAAAGRRTPSARSRASSTSTCAARGRGRAALTSLVLRSLKQAHYSPAQRRPRRPALAALLPLHLADPPLPGPRLPPRAAGGGRRRRGRAGGVRSMEEAGEWCSTRERDAMAIERARRRRRALLPARGRAVRARLGRPEWRGRGHRRDRRRRVRRLRRRLRGPAAGAAPARRLVGAQRAGDDARRRAVGRGAPARRPGRRAGRARRRAARARRPLARRASRAERVHGEGPERKAAPGDVATNRRRPTATTCSSSSRRASCSRAPRSSRCATARRRSRTATRRARRRAVAHNVHIPPYGPAARENHEPERPRKLLVHRREIERLIGKTREKGLTLVPTRIYFKGPPPRSRSRSRKGKDVGDKRRAIKERELKREMERARAATTSLERALEVRQRPSRRRAARSGRRRRRRPRAGGRA